MSVTMRIIQRYDITREKEFLELEWRFAKLEAERPDYPEGKRMKPVAAGEPTNTLVWQCEFPDLAAAQEALDLFATDTAHAELAAKQHPLFEQVRIEFYENLEG